MSSEQPSRHTHRQHLRSITLTWVIDAKGLMVEANDPFCWVMRYSQEEVRRAPATPLLRPHGDPRDPEILAIVDKMQQLKRGDSSEEHITDTWIEAKDGTAIRIADAIMLYNPVSETWQVRADVDIEYLSGLPQMKTPWDSIPWLQHQNAQTQKQVRDLALKLDDQIDLVNRRMVAMHTESELDAEGISTLHQKPTRKERSDKGTTHLKPAEFDKALHIILKPGYITTTQVRSEIRRRCGPGGSAAAFSKYLKPYRLAGAHETPTQIVERLGRTWFPETWVLF